MVVCGDLEHYHGTSDGEDEFVLDTPQMRDFIEHVREHVAASESPRGRVRGDRATLRCSHGRH